VAWLAFAGGAVAAVRGGVEHVGVGAARGAGQARHVGYWDWSNPEVCFVQSLPSPSQHTRNRPPTFWMIEVRIFSEPASDRCVYVIVE
jgi:hypothetical protein